MMEGKPITLEDLGALDLSDFTEARFEALPAGTYLFMVDTEGDNAPDLKVIGEGSNAKLAAVLNCKVMNVEALKNQADAPDGDPLKLIGKNHRETCFLSNDDSLRFLKAFVHDIGVDPNTKLRVAVQSTGGKMFYATIVHRRDKDDADKTYVNIGRQKIRPKVA